MLVRLPDRLQVRVKVVHERFARRDVDVSDGVFFNVVQPGKGSIGGEISPLHMAFDWVLRERPELMGGGGGGVRLASTVESSWPMVPKDVF